MPDMSLTVAETWDTSKTYLEEQLRSGDFSNIVDLQFATWGTLFSTLKKAAFQKRGAEVAEIGSTWLGSLVAMNALRPFSPAEITRLGGVNIFYPPLWESTFVIGDRRVWAIPWLCGTRIVFYWRDMLASANIDPQTAFQTPERFEQTLKRLQTNGVQTPWAAPATQNLNMLHHCASWIWQAGGNFLSKDGQVVTFTQPEAIRGIQAYFRLHTYMPAGSTGFRLFLQRRAAVAMSGPWDWNLMAGGGIESSELAQVGTALPPGPAFVGGSNLVILQHSSSRFERIAIDLIRHLISPDVQFTYSTMVGLLPVRGDLLDDPRYFVDARLKVFVDALKQGRTTPNVPLWGVVEERLTEAFGQIGQAIMAQPEASLETIIRDHLEPLAKRLNRMLVQ
jgi:multiple sugar transport system substrate-binding protein